ncbi:hypothetical protein RFI_31750, partial [Reticulomyxa filosa]
SSNTGSSGNNAPNDSVIHYHNHSSSHSNLFASASLFNIDSANDVANLIGPMEKRFHKKIVYKPLPLTLLQELRQLHFENLSSEISPYFVLPTDDKPTDMPSFELTLQYAFPTQSEAANGASTQTAVTASLSAEQKKKEKSKTQCINEQYDKLLQDIMASCNVSIDRIKTWKDKIHISSPYVYMYMHIFYFIFIQLII